MERVVVTDWPLRYPCGVDVVTVAVEPLEGAVETKVLVNASVTVHWAAPLSLKVVVPVTTPEVKVFGPVPAGIFLGELPIEILDELRPVHVPVAPLIVTVPLTALVMVGPELKVPPFGADGVDPVAIDQVFLFPESWLRTSVHVRVPLFVVVVVPTVTLLTVTGAAVVKLLMLKVEVE